MKKYIGIFLSIMLTVVCLFGCVKKTEYDDKSVVKIIYSGAEGFGMYPLSYVKTFDFETCTVTKKTKYDEPYMNNLLQETEGEEKDNIIRWMEGKNIEIFVTDFTEENKDHFLQKIVKYGIYNWKSEYKTKDIILDAAGYSITIYFSDNTTKSTYFYFEKPSNYEKIANAFITYLNTSISYS